MSYRLLGKPGGGEYRAGQRLKAKRRKEAKRVFPVRPDSRQVVRRKAIEMLKEIRSDMKARASKEKGGSAEVTVEDVRIFLGQR